MLRCARHVTVEYLCIVLKPCHLSSPRKILAHPEAGNQRSLMKKLCSERSISGCAFIEPVALKQEVSDKIQVIITAQLLSFSE